MTRENFLTLRWNNLLSLVLGLVGVIYVMTVLSTSIFSGNDSFIGMVIIGSVF